MMTINEKFYNDRVLLNVLANSLQNAADVYEAAEGHVLIGILSKDYPTVEAAVESMNKYADEIEGAVSIGLGAGDNRQARVVSEIAKHYRGQHYNQVFPYVGMTRANLDNDTSWINALISPTGKVGYVNISTGPISSKSDEAIVPVKAAISLVRDMGGDALKFFPMNGLAHKEEYIAVAKACGEEGFALEPTGGIDLENFKSILDIALEANVPKIIPHVYSSIIDKDSGETKIEDVKRLFEIVKGLV